MSVNWTEIISSGIKQLESDLEVCFSVCKEWTEVDWVEDWSEKDAEYYLAQGIALQQQQKYSQAIKQFTKAIALDSNLYQAYVDRGTCHAESNRLAQGVKDYNRAIEIEANTPNAYLKRGVCLYKLGDLGSAIADFDRVLELNPEQLEAYYRRGAVHAYVGSYQQVIEDFSKLIEINATANKYYNRGVIYYHTEEYDRAIADLTRVIAVEPEFIAAHFALGNAYYALDNQEEAQKSYQLAESIEADLNPNDEHSYYARGIAARNQGQSAREYFSQAAIACRKSNNLKLGLEIALLMKDKELI